MIISRPNIRCWVRLLSLAAAALPLAAIAAPADDGTAQVVISDSHESNEFAVPQGDVATLLAFIEKLANPTQQFASEAELQAYLKNVSKAIGEAADQVMADKTTDRQLQDAIEWKIESLRIRQKLGDANADKQADEFLANLKYPDRPAVEKAIDEIRQNRAAMHLHMELMTKLRTWPRLDAAQREQVTDWLIDAVKTGGASGAHAGMLIMFCETLSDTPDSAIAKKALAELLPLFRASDSPGVAQLLPRLEGLNRRLNLLGNKLELAGTFLDGEKLDWASYGGKVVLVDFWATWCGPCRAEVPNMLENYLKYHDQGFDVIGISLDDKRSDADEYVSQTNIPWPSLFQEPSDEGGWQNPMAVKYGVTSIPTAILVDQEGNVVSMHATGPRLGALLEKLLGKPSEAKSSDGKSVDEAQRTAQSEER